MKSKPESKPKDKIILPMKEEGAINTIIVGSQYIEDKSPFREIGDDDLVILVLEKNNELDQNAIRVEDTKGRKLGYIPKGKDQIQLNKLLSKGTKLTSKIDDAVSLTIKIEY